MQLTGNSLGQRQKDLNLKVNKATAENVPFETIKDQPEESDIDRLFKIDLASKYQNMQYLIETLKCADSLYISKALKCVWMYEDKYAEVINSDYLHQNIFPFMSIKIKKKFLTTISTYVRNESRAKDWFEYCMSTDLKHFAFKFLIFTSLQYKIDLIKNNFEKFDLDEPSDIKYFIGKDITLAELYLEKLSKSQAVSALCNLSYFYSIDVNLFLRWIEKYCKPESMGSNYLGLKVSRSILKHHKDRTLQNVKLYIALLDRKFLTKNTSVKEAKLYITALLPQNDDMFWNINFVKSVDWLLNLVPAEEKYEFIRKIFNEHYPGKEFEMSKDFYNLRYYEYMTVDQREEWALRQLSNPDKTILGNGFEDLDYMWYKYVNFDKAIFELKKYLLVAPNATRRMEIICVLIQSARNQRELEKIINYFYEHHINESKDHRVSFIYAVLNHHNIFNVDERCWTAFNKILYSVEVYNQAENFSYYRNRIFFPAVLIYHVIHNYDLPETLHKYLNSDIHHFELHHYFQPDIKKLDSEKKEIVYKYCLKSRVDKIKSYDEKEYNEEAIGDIRMCVNFIQELNRIFDKSEEIDIDVVLKYMKLDPVYFYRNLTKTVSQKELLKLLKQDTKQFLDKLPLVKQTLGKHELKLNTLLKILKTYFSNDSKDIAQECLKFYLQLLTDETIYFGKSAAVYAVFQLADEKFKIEFLEKYAPSNPKIDHEGIDRTHLYIQEAICRLVGYSRPPMPLSNVLAYIKGDYLQYCVPMFNMYLMKFPIHACLEFVESLLNAPVSIQKHGLRLAFSCFSTDNLKSLIHRVWKQSKNISLRAVIYKYLFEDILRKSGANQAEFFEILLSLTLDLHQDDHFEIIECITTDSLLVKLPDEMKGRYLENCWKAVNLFPHSMRNVKRQVDVIQNIEIRIEVMDNNFIKGILQEYFNDRLINKTIIPNENKPVIPEDDLIDAKLQLALTYIARSDYDNYLNSGIELTEFVTEKCMAMWNEAYSNAQSHYELYYCRAYIHEFINGLINNQFSVDNKLHGASNRIFNTILVKMQKSLPVYEMYIILWKLRLVIIANEVIDEVKTQMKDIQLSETDFMKVVSKYATDVIGLVKELAGDKKFHLSLMNEIGEAIKTNIQKLRTELYLTNKAYSIELDDLYVFISLELANTAITECVLLAINILPDGIPKNSLKDFKKLFQTIHAIENYEIQSLLYQKFVKSGFKNVVQ